MSQPSPTQNTSQGQALEELPHPSLFSPSGAPQQGREEQKRPLPRASLALPLVPYPAAGRLPSHRQDSFGWTEITGGGGPRATQRMLPPLPLHITSSHTHKRKRRMPQHHASGLALATEDAKKRDSPGIAIWASWQNGPVNKGGQRHQLPCGVPPL